MNGFLLKENKELKEKYYYKELECGLKITVISKDFPNKSAFICCNFGGADLEYRHEGKVFTLPSGTAHFLEHKMFETADGSDAFLEFDKFGGNANAFTSFENTCYYFSCTENFFENLEVLLSSVSGFHCSEESVQKEQKIIAREIMMYEDVPSSNLTRNLSKALYHSHPIIHPIAGTLDSISQISKEVLERAFEHFYCPKNLSLCVCGDVSPEEIKATAEKFFEKSTKVRPETLFPREPENVCRKRIESNAVVGSPLYAVGIKCAPSQKNDKDALKKATAMRLAISLTFGRASDFYCHNYKKGLLNERFYAGYTSSRENAHIIISGSGNSYDEVSDAVIKEIQTRKALFFTEEQFLREKKAAYAESITLFDSGDDLAAAMAECCFLDYDEFDYIDIIRSITVDEVKTALCSIDTSKIAVSIIKNS